MTAYRLRDRLASIARTATKREAARLQKMIVVIVEAAENEGWVSDRHASKKRVKPWLTLRVVP